jgi:hypothetical protein
MPWRSIATGWWCLLIVGYKQLQINENRYHYTTGAAGQSLADKGVAETHQLKI